MNHPKNPSKLNRTGTGKATHLDELLIKKVPSRSLIRNVWGLSYYCDYGSKFGKHRKNGVEGQHY